MPLRGFPLPRMAGLLPFMRGKVGTINDIVPGMIVVLGATKVCLNRADLAPLALRETSAYFGSHFNSNMKSAMDIDQRRMLKSAAIAKMIIDLGDIADDQNGLGNDMRDIIGKIIRKDAIPLILGGDRSIVTTVYSALLNRKEAQRISSLIYIGCEPEKELKDQVNKTSIMRVQFGEAPDDIYLFSVEELSNNMDKCVNKIAKKTKNSDVYLALDLTALSAHWHGANHLSSFGGISLSLCRRLLRELGKEEIKCVSLTGLDPTINGLSIVKTGQRLMLTAILDLFYARVDALEPRINANV